VQYENINVQGYLPLAVNISIQNEVQYLSHCTNFQLLENNFRFQISKQSFSIHINIRDTKIVGRTIDTYLRFFLPCKKEDCRVPTELLQQSRDLNECDTSIKPIVQ